MTFSLKPELQKLVEEKVKAGLFPLAEALVNSAVEQFVADDDFEPGEMERLLAIGERQAEQEKFVDGDQVFAKLAAKSRRGHPKAGRE